MPNSNEEGASAFDASTLVLSNPKFVARILRQAKIYIAVESHSTDWNEFCPEIDLLFLRTTKLVNKLFYIVSCLVAIEDSAYSEKDISCPEGVIIERLASVRYLFWCNISSLGTFDMDKKFTLELIDLLPRAHRLERAYLNLMGITGLELKDPIRFTKSLTHLSLQFGDDPLDLCTLVLPPSLVYLSLNTRTETIRGQLTAPRTLKTLVLIRDSQILLEDKHPKLDVPLGVSHLVLNEIFVHFVNIRQTLKRLTVVSPDRDTTSRNLPQGILSRTRSLVYRRTRGYSKAYDIEICLGVEIMRGDARRDSDIIERYRNALSHLEELKNVSFIVELRDDSVHSTEAIFYPVNLVKLSLKCSWCYVKRWLKHLPRLRHLTVDIDYPKDPFESVDLREFPQLRSVKLKGNFEGSVWLNEGLERFHMDLNCAAVLKTKRLPSTLKDFAPNWHYVPAKGGYPDSLAKFTICVEHIAELSFDDLPPKIEHLVVYSYGIHIYVPGVIKLTGKCPETLKRIDIQDHILTKDSVLPYRIEVRPFETD